MRTTERFCAADRAGAFDARAICFWYASASASAALVDVVRLDGPPASEELPPCPPQPARTSPTTPAASHPPLTGRSLFRLQQDAEVLAVVRVLARADVI